MEQITKADAIRKLQKLKTMYERATGPEARNAGRLIDTLMEKYAISSDELVERTRRALGTSSKTLFFASHVAVAMELTAFTQGKCKSIIYVDATPDEFVVFRQAVIDLNKLYASYEKKEIQKAKNKARSYVAGFVLATYPIKNRPEQNGKSSTQKSMNSSWDYEAMLKGEQDAATMITHKEEA